MNHFVHNAVRVIRLVFDRNYNVPVTIFTPGYFASKLCIPAFKSRLSLEVLNGPRFEMKGSVFQLKHLV